MKLKIKAKALQLTVKVKLPSGVTVNEQDLNAFCRKPIRGFMKPNLVKPNVIEYTGPAGFPLQARMREPISKYDFFLIVEQIVETAQTIQRNGLPMDRVLWNLDSTFINRSTKELRFLYLPLSQGPNADSDILAMIQNLIYAAKPFPNDNTDFVSKFSYFMHSVERFDAPKIEAFVQKFERGAYQTVKANNPGDSSFLTDKRGDYYDHYKNRNGQDDEATGLLAEDDGDEATGLLNDPDDEATGLLVDDSPGGHMRYEAPPHYPTLLRLSTQETVQISKKVFRLGRERGSTDYCVTGNNIISRSHADIVVRGNRCFVTDLNSANKTYINDQILAPQTETELFDGDCLRLGNEEFIFHL